jgi:hypothetical protein
MIRKNAPLVNEKDYSNLLAGKIQPKHSKSKQDPLNL